MVELTAPAADELVRSYRQAEAIVLGLAGGVTCWLLLGPPIVVATGLGGPAAAFWWRGVRRRQVQRQRRMQLPEGLERMATAVRASSSLTQALSSAGAATPNPLGHELTGLAREAEHGRSVAVALDGWVADHDDAGTRLAATALALATKVGAAPARALDGVAATLRERQEVAAERRALATQAKASAAVLSVAPVGFALLLGATDGAAARFLFDTTAGWACLLAGLALDATGAVWMSRIIRGDDEAQSR